MTLRQIFIIAAVASLALVVSLPAAAQEDQLFDRFSVALEGGLVVLDTNIRLDSKRLGLGTELDFESDGGVASSKVIPALSFAWQVGRRHRIGGWYQNVDRSNTEQILQEIKFGDQVFPIDEVVTFSTGTEELGLGYTYFIKRTDRYAWGIGGGIRTLKESVSLAAQGLELSSEGDFTGPLPFVAGEGRVAIGSRWRFVGNLGLFYIEIGDYSGKQYILDATMEHLTLDWLSLGFGLRASKVNVSVDTSDFRGEANIAIGTTRVFARLRF
jgi:hypothetical protein